MNEDEATEATDSPAEGVEGAPATEAPAEVEKAADEADSKPEPPKKPAPRRGRPSKQALEAEERLAETEKRLADLEERLQREAAAREAAEKQAALTAKAAELGVPVDIFTMDREADPEAFVKAVREAIAPGGVTTTPTITLKTGDKAGGADPSGDSALREAAAKGDKTALNTLRFAQLSAASTRL